MSADDQAKPSEGITAVQKLVTRDGAVALVSCSYSGATRSAAGVAQSSKIPMVVSYAVHPEITKAGNYVWRMFSLGRSRAARWRSWPARTPRGRRRPSCG